jgi:transcriptional regulator with XRE-family HTH domain
MAARGITSNESLADRLGLSLSTVKRVMSGEQQPSSAFIAAVCIHLGLEFSVFLDVEAPARRIKAAVA